MLSIKNVRVPTSAPILKKNENELFEGEVFDDIEPILKIHNGNLVFDTKLYVEYLID